MTSLEMVRVLVSLASGTLAGLFCTGDYATLDAMLAQWVEWVAAQPERRWESWGECWEAYIRSRRIARYLRIISPDGVDLGMTPLNPELEMTDGSYGLLDHCYNPADEDNDRAHAIERHLLKGIRRGHRETRYQGFVGQLVVE